MYTWSDPDRGPARVGSAGGVPVWASDGSAIAWAAGDGIYRRDLAEATALRLSQRRASGRVAWSPRDAEIAFVDRDEEALVVLDSQSGEVRFSISAVTGDAEHQPLALSALGGPSWSPDGSRLAFNCWDGHGDEVCVVGSNGAGLRQVTDIQNRRSPVATSEGALMLAASNTGPPAWSPDGSELAVAVYPEQRNAPGGVYIVDLEQGAARRISSKLPNSEVAWFGDGSALLFSATDQGRSDVLRVPRDGGEAAVLTAELPGGAREPSLSPNGARMAVVNEGDVVLLDMDGDVESVLDVASSVRTPRWSPDGNQIAWEAVPDPLRSYS